MQKEDGKKPSEKSLTLHARAGKLRYFVILNMAHTIDV